MCAKRSTLDSEANSDLTVESHESLRQKIDDPFYLPTRREIALALQTEEEWLSYVNSSSFFIYELLNTEYVEALAEYLIQRTEHHTDQNDIPPILEICAGNGRLSGFLNQQFAAKSQQIRCVASDTGEWEEQQYFPVEQLSNSEALQKYNPKIVLASWMPTKVDFSEEIRQHPTVDEYLLIGEPNAGCCGHTWKTWGIRSDDQIQNGDMALYRRDGFERTDLDELSKLQTCRMDYPREHRIEYSETVSFRRK